MYSTAATVRATTPIQVSLKTKGVAPRAKLDGFVRQRIKTYLGRFNRRLRRVDVWLEDLNGPRGGIDTRCRIEVHLRPRGILTATAQAIDEYVAVTKAATRTRTLLIRRYKRPSSRRRTWLTRKRSRKRAELLPQPQNTGNDMNTIDMTRGLVSIGSTIGILDLHTNEIERYTLTHPRDADIAHNRISSLTPMGRAIYGRTIGDTVEVDAPGGTFRVRIETIEDPAADEDRAEELAWAG